MHPNHHIVLSRPPQGRIRPTDFCLMDCDFPGPGPDQALLEVEWLAMDPYLRSVIAGRHPGAALVPGERMPGQGIARVVAAPSSSPVRPGDRVVTECGWTKWIVRPVSGLRPLRLPADIPAQAALGVLGMPGLTAWAGLHRLGDLQSGEVVAVSSASGTVGAAVIHLARALGCTTIGITSASKSDYVGQRLGCDFVLDRGGELISQFKSLPRIDVYFDNAGGDSLAAALEHLAQKARVVLCGMMAQYEMNQRPPGPNLGPLIAARASMHGLVVYDHFDAMPEFLDRATDLYRQNRLYCHETVYQGLGQAPEAFCALMSGATHGRVLVNLTSPQDRPLKSGPA